MINDAIKDAVAKVCRQEGLGGAFESSLAALINNAMRDNLDDSDIEDLLSRIPVEEPSDAD